MVAKLPKTLADFMMAYLLAAGGINGIRNGRVRNIKREYCNRMENINLLNKVANPSALPNEGRPVLMFIISAIVL
jgi:hypothetical protein